MNIHALIKDCQKGKRSAQRELYEHFAGQMLGICYRYTKQSEDAEDVLQEGFIKVFKNIHTYRFEGEFGGWVRRIMVNTALNYLKSHNRYSRELKFDREEDNHTMLSLSLIHI